MDAWGGEDGVEQDAKPAPERRPEPAPRDDVRVAALSRCPFCHADAGVAASRGVCAACLARHHEACWSETGRCASCGHTVRLELPQPRGPSLTPLLAVIVAILVSILGGAGMLHGEARARELAASLQRQEAEARLVAERAAAAQAARDHEDSTLIARSKLAEAQARASDLEEDAADALARARALAERLNATQEQLRDAELRALRADARAKAAEDRVEHLKMRLNMLDARTPRPPADVPAWDRSFARASALAAIARAAARDGVTAAEQARLVVAREALLAPPEAPPASFLAHQPALLMFPVPDHAEFMPRTTRALAEFGQATDALRRAYVAHVRLARGDVDRGLSDAEAALDAEATCGLAWLVRAQARHALGDLAGAADDALVGEALDDGRSCWSLYTRAMIHVARGEHAEAAKQLEVLRALGGVDRGLGLDLIIEPLLKEQRDRALLPRPR